MPSSTPPSSEPAIQRGARLLAEGRAGEAVDVLQALVTEAPIYAAAHVLLAAALDADGQTDDALDMWHRAAFLTPSSPLVQRERQRLLRGDAPAPPAASGADERSAEPETDPLAPAGDTPPTPEPDAPPTDETSADEVPTHEVPTDEPTTDEPVATDDAPTPPAAPDAQRAEPPSDLPEGAHVAPADELFTTTMPPAGPDPEAEPSRSQDPEPSLSEPEPPPAPTRAVPDWGDLDEAALAVLPPDLPETPPPPPTDPGGWEVLAETVHAPREAGSVAPPIVRPEAWSGTDAPPPAPLAGAPTAPSHTPDGPHAAGPGAPDPPAAPHAAAVYAVPESAASSDPADDGALADDLDALIESLETAPRITPDPDFDAPLPDLDRPVDDLASETLAKIYAAQHQYVEAAVVYERLAARAPERAETLLERAAEMRRQAGP